MISVFDDGSSDNSARLLAEVPHTLRLVSGPGRSGKAHGMKQMAASSTAKFLIFTDANVTVAENCVEVLSQVYLDDTVGGVCGTLRYVAEGMTETAQAGGFYWKLEEWIKDLESRTGNVMGADGSLFSIRQELYPAFPDSVQDDFTSSMSVVYQGKRLIKSSALSATEDPVTEANEEFRRKVRIAARAFHTHRCMRDGLVRLKVLDRYKYFSHKVMRWWGGALLTLSIALLLTGTLILFPTVATALLLALAFGACVALLCVPVKPVPTLRSILVSIMATTWGCFRAVRVVRFTTWNPPPRL